MRAPSLKAGGFALELKSVSDSTQQPKKTIVYIDGFNFYYGALRNGKKRIGKKWLNIESWLLKIFKPAHYNINKIKFFTAKVSGTKSDPQKPVRQQVYFRALKTIPKIEIIFGNFIKRNIFINITDEVSIRAKAYEEKGTDVNIAAHIVNDGHKGLYDTAIVVCNDSDIADALRIVTKELNLEVILVNPSKGNATVKLSTFASFVKQVREGQLIASQFPQKMNDQRGEFSKPLSW